MEYRLQPASQTEQPKGWTPTASAIRTKGSNRESVPRAEWFLHQRVAPGGDLIWKKLGVRIGTVNPDLVTRVNAQLDGGLLITDISPESPAAQAGFQRGDILVGLHQWKTVSADNVVFVLTHPDLASMSPLRFFIIRGGQIRRGHLSNLD